jgi:hypothetical protein
MLRDFVASGGSLNRVKLYMSVGEDEEIDDRMTSWKMVSGFCDMVKSIKKAAIPGLQIMSEIFPAESHVTVTPSAFIHGVQAVYGTRRIVHSVSC